MRATWVQAGARARAGGKDSGAVPPAGSQTAAAHFPPGAPSATAPRSWCRTSVPEGVADAEFRGQFTHLPSIAESELSKLSPEPGTGNRQDARYYPSPGFTVHSLHGRAVPGAVPARAGGLAARGANPSSVYHAGSAG
jgi:hypothetical protein